MTSGVLLMQELPADSLVTQTLVNKCTNFTTADKLSLGRYNIFFYGK